MTPCGLKHNGKCLVSLRECTASRCAISPGIRTKGVLKREELRRERRAER